MVKLVIQGPDASNASWPQHSFQEDDRVVMCSRSLVTDEYVPEMTCAIIDSISRFVARAFTGSSLTVEVHLPRSVLGNFWLKATADQ